MFHFTNLKKDIINVQIGSHLYKDVPIYIPCSSKKKDTSTLADKRLVDTNHLMEMLDCGKHTAVKIGNLAKAKVCIERKLFWNVKLIQQYLDNVAE